MLSHVLSNVLMTKTKYGACANSLVSLKFSTLQDIAKNIGYSTFALYCCGLYRDEKLMSEVNVVTIV